MKLAFLLLLSGSLIFADRLPKVDDSASDPSFLAFKVRLLAAIQRRDLKAVQSMAVEAVRAKLTLPALADIATAVQLGVVHDEQDFIAPYVFVRFPHELDAYTHAAAIRAAVKVRARPLPTAPVVETLDYDIVILTGVPKNGWVEVQTPSGKSGWALRSDLRTQLEPRVFFENRNSEWKITDFVSGD